VVLPTYQQHCRPAQLYSRPSGKARWMCAPPSNAPTTGRGGGPLPCYGIVMAAPRPHGTVASSPRRAAPSNSAESTAASRSSCCAALRSVPTVRWRCPFARGERRARGEGARGARGGGGGSSTPEAARDRDRASSTSEIVYEVASSAPHDDLESISPQVAQVRVRVPGVVNWCSPLARSAPRPDRAQLARACTCACACACVRAGSTAETAGDRVATSPDFASSTSAKHGGGDGGGGGGARLRAAPRGEGVGGQRGGSVNAAR
jgi:hypothetical protein